MKQSKQHPLALPTHARIDVSLGGSQESIIRDSLTLAQQALSYLSKGENVMYLNTCASSRTVDDAAMKLSEERAAKVIAFTAFGAGLMDKLEFLQKTMESKQVKLLILNSFEFAAMTTRQRTRVVHWLRELRDELGLRIVVYSISRPELPGAVSILSWLADEMEQTGEWRTAMAREDHELHIKQTNTTEAVKIFLRMNYEFSGEGSLKNKDLRAVSVEQSLATNDDDAYLPEDEDIMEEAFEEEVDFA